MTDHIPTQTDPAAQAAKTDCRVCGGDGYIDEPVDRRSDTGPPTSECEACNGTGRERVTVTTADAVPGTYVGTLDFDEDYTKAAEFAQWAVEKFTEAFETHAINVTRNGLDQINYRHVAQLNAAATLITEATKALRS